MQRRSTMLVVLLLAAAVITGCLGSSGGKSTYTGSGSMVVSLDFPSEVRPQSVGLKLASVEVEIKLGKESFRKESPIRNNSASIEFDGLRPGEWTVEVDVLDQDGFIVYSGYTVAVIKSNDTVEVTVAVELEPGNLSVAVEIPELYDVKSGSVTLVNPVGEDFKEQLVFEETQGKAFFADIKATTWPIQVSLYDTEGEQVAFSEDVVQVLPGRTTNAFIALSELTEGGLTITITLETPPPKPIGLYGERTATYVELQWTLYAAELGYWVYRSESEDSQKRLLTDTLIYDSYFVDDTVEDTKGYYYWVQAYSSTGLASALSGPVFVEPYVPTPQIEGQLTWAPGYTPLDPDWSNYEIWVVPILRGEGSIREGIRRYSATIPVSEDGHFFIDVPSLYLPSADDHVLILINPNIPQPPEQVRAVISMKTGNTIIAHLPLQELRGLLDLGTVTVDDRTAHASKAIEDNGEVFSAAVIDKLATTDKFKAYAELIANDYINYHDEQDYYYISHIQHYHGSKEQISYLGTELHLITPDSDTPFKFKAPSGTVQEDGGNYGSQSTVKWSDFAPGVLESGWYSVLDAHTESEIARFMVGNHYMNHQHDFTVIPLIEQDFNGQGEVMGMWFDWLLGMNGEIRPLDLFMVEELIDRRSFYIECPAGRFIFDGTGSPSMEGDFTYVSFDTPWTWSEHTTVSIGFSFGTRRFSFEIK